MVHIFGSADCMKKKKATINPKKPKKYGKCFQYAVMIALNYAEITLNSERVSNIKPFKNKCNWKRINYP